MAKGITTNSKLINRSNYVLRAQRLRKHEANGTLLPNERTGHPGARRRFQNTKGNWVPQKDGKEPQVYV